jgi:HEAT repeat protein
VEKELAPDLLKLLESPAKEQRKRGIGEVLTRRLREGLPVLDRIAVSDRENDLRYMAHKAARLLREELLERVAAAEGGAAAPPAGPAGGDPAAAASATGAAAAGGEPLALSDERVAALVQALKDPLATARQHAVVALGRRGANDVVPRLIELAAREADPDVKASAARALGQCADAGSRSGIATLLDATLLRAPDPRVRIAALEGIAAMDARECAAGVIERLRDEDERVQDLARRQVERWGAQVALTTARSMLLTVRVDARKAAVHALMLSGEPSVVPMLAWALGDPVPAVAAGARMGLEMLASQGVDAAAAALARAAAAADAAEVPPAATGLDAERSAGESGGGSRLAPGDPLRNPEPARRLEEIRNVLDREDIARGPALLAALAHERDLFVLSALVNALGRLKHVQALPSLVPLLASTDARVRANAVEVIGWLGQPEDLERLEPLLADADNRVRANAIVACHVLPGVNLGPALNEMLSSPDPAMRKSAVYAIRTIGDPRLVRLIKDARRSSQNPLTDPGLPSEPSELEPSAPPEPSDPSGRAAPSDPTDLPGPPDPPDA